MPVHRCSSLGRLLLATRRPLALRASRCPTHLGPHASARCRQQESVDDKAKNYKTIYKLESTAKDGNDKIEAFVNVALDVYRKQQTTKVRGRASACQQPASCVRVGREGDSAAASADAGVEPSDRWCWYWRRLVHCCW